MWHRVGPRQAVVINGEVIHDFEVEVDVFGRENVVLRTEEGIPRAHRHSMRPGMVRILSVFKCAVTSSHVPIPCQG